MAGDIFDQIHAEAQNAPPEPVVAAGNGDIFDQIHGEAQKAPGLTPSTIGPGPGMLGRGWNDIKAGLTAAQPGAGLPVQPTALGNAAEFAGMLGTEAGQLGVGPGLAEGAGAIENLIPSAERAGKTFQELKGSIGTHTVAMTDRLADALGEIKQAADTGSTLPSVVNKFATRIADVDKGPLTYNEARQFYHNVSDLSASEKMAAKGNDLRLLQEFKHALGETVAQTAESANKLEKYQSAMSEFAKSQRLKEGVKTVGKLALGAGGLGGAYTTYRTIADLMRR
jgi:hypothetical protein